MAETPILEAGLWRAMDGRRWRRRRGEGCDRRSPEPELVWVGAEPGNWID